MTNAPEKFSNDFDDTFDVVVAGFGFAGAASAISAAEKTLRKR